MKFRILGPLEVDHGGRRIELGGPRQRALLAILLLHRGEVVPADRLAGELYGKRAPETAAKSLQVHMSRLRKALGNASSLRTVGGGYVLDVAPEELDLARFGELTARGRSELAAGKPDLAASTFHEALALWRGPPLVDFAYEDFAQSEIARLEELRLGAIEERIEADLAIRRHAQLVGELERLVNEYPLRERLRGQLMLALYRSGRQAEALEAYQGGRRLLSDELGLDPGRPLRELERAILQQDPGLDLPTPSDGSREPSTRTFVGRQRELAELEKTLAEALAGSGRIVLIAGEPGIGKSRLADELIGHARTRGAKVLVGRCWEAGGAPAYWPWVQSLRTYIRDCDPDALREQLGAGASDLAQVFGELHELFPGLPEPPSLEAEGARFRLFDAVAAFLKDAARAQPLVLVLDDLHAADEPSLLLLQFLARELGDSRLFVLGAYRDVDPTLRDPLVATLSELIREPVTQRISLQGLTKSNVAEYISVATPADPDEATVAEIYAETEGNPLFVGELVRLLTIEGRLERTDGPLAIPSGVREVIESRVRRLPEPCRATLTLASVLGREFTLDALEQVSELPRDDLLDVLDEAMAEQVVGDVPGAFGRLRFAHVLIRDTLYDGLTRARRVRLHRQAGEALEVLYAENLAPHLAELAYHFAEAAPAGDVRKAIDYARRAGDAAVALLAYEEAGRQYELGLVLAQASDVERCELLLALGDAQARAGDTPASKRAFREAAELAETLDLDEHLARAALGYGGRFLWEVSRDDDYTLRVLETALAALGEKESTLRVRVLARMAGGPLRDDSFPREKSASLSREALEIARRIGDSATLAYALSCFNAAHHSPGHTREQVMMATELIDLALEAGDLERAMEGHEHRGVALIELGHMHRGKADVASMAMLAKELRQPTHDWFVAGYQALLALLEGRLAEAEGLISDARGLGERAQSWSAAVSYGLQLYVLRWLQGRLAEMEALVRHSVDQYPTYAVWRCVGAHMAAELGYVSESRNAFEALAKDEFAALRFDEEWLVSMGFLAETAISLRDAQRTSVLYERLVPYAGRVTIAYPEIAIGSVSRYLGRLAATMERWEDAEHHFDDALDLNERIGARPWLALTRRDYAEMLLRRDAPGDRQRAHELRHSASELADEIGMALA